MTEYDLDKMRRLGRRRTKLLDQLDRVMAELRPEIHAALEAGVTLADVARASEITRGGIYKMGYRPAGTP